MLDLRRLEDLSQPFLASILCRVYGVLPRTRFGVRESRTAPYGRPREDRNGAWRDSEFAQRIPNHHQHYSCACMVQSQPEEFDLVILGGGTGSTIAAWTFAGEGKRVPVVDRKYIGGSCPKPAFRARTLSIVRKLWTTSAEAKSLALLTMASR